MPEDQVANNLKGMDELHSRSGPAASGIRVNAICPGIIDTVMIERVTGGTQTRRQQMISAEPVGRLVVDGGQAA